MSNVKERLLGAITVMSEQDAAALWKFIIDDFTWKNIETATPDEIDLEMLADIENNPDCKAFVSADEAMKELGL